MNWPDLTLPPINLYNAPMTWKAFKDLVENGGITDDTELSFIDVEFSDQRPIHVTRNVLDEGCVWD